MNMPIHLPSKKNLPRLAAWFFTLLIVIAASGYVMDVIVIILKKGYEFFIQRNTW